MYTELHAVEVTTDAEGAATAYTSRPVSGRVLAVIYEKTDFANGVDFDVTTERSGQTVWSEDNVNAAKICYPRAQVHTTAGVAATLDGTRAMLEPVVAGEERLKIVVAQGGAAKQGTFKILIG